MFLHGHVREVHEGVVELLNVAGVLGGAEAREAVDEEVDPEGPEDIRRRIKNNIRRIASGEVCTRVHILSLQLLDKYNRCGRYLIHARSELALLYRKLVDIYQRGICLSVVLSPGMMMSSTPPGDGDRFVPGGCVVFVSRMMIVWTPRITIDPSPWMMVSSLLMEFSLEQSIDVFRPKIFPKKGLLRYTLLVVSSPRSVLLVLKKTALLLLF